MFVHPRERLFLTLRPYIGYLCTQMSFRRMCLCIRATNSSLTSCLRIKPSTLTRRKSLRSQVHFRAQPRSLSNGKKSKRAVRGEVFGPEANNVGFLSSYTVMLLFLIQFVRFVIHLCTEKNP